MSNTLSVVDMVAAQALKIAHEKATFLGTVNKQFDETYKAMPEGGKYGQTLRVRNPNQYTRRSGSRVMDVQDTTETTQTITVATQDGVDLRFNSAELSQSIGYLTERYIQPAMSVLVSSIDGDCLATATKQTYNVAHGGTRASLISLGTVASGFADTTALGLARARINQGAAPKDASGRSLQLDSLTMAAVANGIKGLFNPRTDIEEAFREGFVARTAMADIYENERAWTLANGSDVTVDTNAAAGVTDGGNTIKMYTAWPIADQVAGMVFTIPGVYACHPETKQPYSYLQDFTVITPDPGTSGTVVSPTIYLTGARKNVCSSTGADLATTAFNSQTLTFFGAASTSYRQGLMYHKDAFAFVTAELPRMDDAIKCTTMTKDGLSLRVWQASDIRNDEMLLRIDILYGFKVLRPEWACRVY